MKSLGEILLLMKLLPTLQSSGHKEFILSQTIRVLNLLEELIRLNKFRCERLDNWVNKI